MEQIEIRQKAMRWRCPGFGREPHWVNHPLGPEGLCGPCGIEQARHAAAHSR